MRALRQQNPLLFDLLLFLLFTIVSFAAYFLAESAGSTGAVISLIILGAVCLALVLSR